MHRYMVNTGSKIIGIWAYLKVIEPCETYKIPHHQLMVALDSLQGETCWPFRLKLMINITYFPMQHTVLYIATYS